MRYRTHLLDGNSHAAPPIVAWLKRNIAHSCLLPSHILYPSKKRGVPLDSLNVRHKIQQKVYEEAYFMPLWQLGFLCVTGPRVAVSGLGLIPDYIYSAPYEDVRLQA